MHVTKADFRRTARLKSLLTPLASPLFAILLSLVVGAFLIPLAGESPLRVYGVLVQGTLGRASGLGEVLYRATQLMFTGLAVAIPFRAGLFNIGAEGQMLVGSFAMAWVGTVTGELPAGLLVPLALMAGALAGGLWGALPGFLKARTGSHEVINTIMMNFVALGVTGYLLTHRLGVPQTLHTSPIAAAAHLPSLGEFFPGLGRTPANLSLLAALVAAAALAVLLWRTKTGLEIRAIGVNPLAARCVGIPSTRVTTLTLALGGALAGLAGANTVLGYRHYFEDGLGAGTGFMGIAVALVARNHPVAVVPVAIFFGVLSYGGLIIDTNTMVPRELVQILQGLVMISLLVSSGVGSALLRWRARLGSSEGTC